MNKLTNCFTWLIAFLSAILGVFSPVRRVNANNKEDVVIFRQDGSMQLNYKNEDVQKNISEQVNTFSKIKLNKETKTTS